MNRFTAKLLPIDDVKPYKNNPRKNDEAVQSVARSIELFGFRQPIVVDEKNVILAGHTRWKAAKVLGLVKVPVHIATGLTAKQAQAYRLADNKVGEKSSWDDSLLAVEIKDLMDAGFDIADAGFEAADIDALFGGDDDGKENEKEDDIPEIPAEPVTAPGDIWILGKHRVMCGDSTNKKHVAALMDGQVAALIHADPPYGMGKESDGVLNDNLRKEKLDAFQKSWWEICRPFCKDNGSIYIWGNAENLWRFWFTTGINTSEEMLLRNEIVWDKKGIPGMKSEDLTQFPIASERCLFIQFGKQFLGNINSEDYPEEYDLVRVYLETEANDAGLKSKDIKEICGCQMYGHWFTKSQFTLIPKKHYVKLQARFPDNFKKDWSELKATWDKIKGAGRGVIGSKLATMRSYFDNAHDIMRDVWEFSRVTNAERFGHATPKPVAMMRRIMKSSLPPGGLCLEPFGGSGSTLIGAEETTRVCYTMELSPEYVDVIVRRWQDFTGKQATRVADKKKFNQVKTNGKRTKAHTDTAEGNKRQPRKAGSKQKRAETAAV